jgi:hypothetical protein
MPTYRRLKLKPRAPKPVRKSPAVLVTNPAASRLPSGLGTRRATPTPPALIAPKTIPASRQITPGERVKITNPASFRANRGGDA